MSLSLAEMAQAAETTEVPATPTAESTTEAVETTATETTTETPAAEESSEEPEEDLSGQFFEEMRTLAGATDEEIQELQSKYQSPDQVMRGLLEARRLVGRRSQEADAYRWLAQQGFDATAYQQFRQWQQSQGQKPEATDAKAAPEEWDKWLAMTDDKLAPTAFAPADVSKRYAQRQIEALKLVTNPTVTEFLKDPAAFIQRHAAPLTEQAQRQTSEQMAAARDAQTVNEFIERHKALMHPDGDRSKPFTPFGQAVDAIFASLNPAMSVEERLKMAHDLAAAKNQPKVPDRTVPEKSKRTPNSAGAAPAKKTFDSWLDNYRKKTGQSPSMTVIAAAAEAGEYTE